MSKTQITIEGFVAFDPEMRDARGKQVLNVTVPVTPSKLVDGVWVNNEEETVWFQAAFWEEHAVAVSAAITKSSYVSISGSVGMDAFTKGDGTADARVKITNPTISLVIRRPSKNAKAPYNAPVAATANAAAFPNDDADTPF